jgi:ParB family chromosome partitioning protein
MTTQIDKPTEKKTITIEMPPEPEAAAPTKGNGKSDSKPDPKSDPKPVSKAGKAEPTKAEASTVGKELDLKPNDIAVDVNSNARQAFDRDQLVAMAGSLKQVGIINPLDVYQDTDGKYHLIAGERRLRAAKLAGLATVRVKVFPNEPVLIAVIRVDENLHTAKLNPMEEADAYSSLLGKSTKLLGEKADAVITQKWLAHRYGKTEGYISQRLALKTNLQLVMQTALRKGDITFIDARTLCEIKDPTKQTEQFENLLKDRKEGRKELARTAEKARHEKRQSKGGKSQGRPATSDVEGVPNVVRQGCDKALERLRTIKKLDVRGNREVREGLETAYERYERAQSEERRQYLKGVTATLEWMAGFRQDF